MNCSDKECYIFTYLEATCSPVPFSLAHIALCLCLVSLSFYVIHCWRLNVISQGHIHLLSLTISDLLVALPCLLAGWWIRSLPLASHLKPAYPAYMEVWIFTYSLPYYGNRWLIVYIGQRRLHAVRDAYFRASERGRSVAFHSWRVLLEGYLPGVLVATAMESARLGLGFSGRLTKSQTENMYAGMVGLMIMAITITSAVLAFKTVNVILSWRFNGERVAKAMENEDTPTEANGESKYSYSNFYKSSKYESEPGRS